MHALIARRLRSGWYAAFAIALMGSGAGWGQTLGVAPDRPDQARVVVPAKTAPKPPGRVKAGALPSAPFMLRAVFVQGSSLDESQLRQAYAGFVDGAMDQARLQALLDAMSATYAASDVALYTILVPEQDFASGALRLEVIEGRIATVEVRGHILRRRITLLDRYAARLKQERPLRKSSLQRVAALIRDIPGIAADLKLETDTDRGAVKLVIDATDHRVQAAFGINNRGTALLGRTQMQGDLYVNALANGADQVHATIALPASHGRFAYYAGSYLTPLDADGTTGQVNLGYLRTRPPILQVGHAIVRLKGHFLSYGAQITRPLLLRNNRTVNLIVGIDGSDSNSALLGIRLSNDRVRAFRTSLAYGATSARSEFAVSAAASLGLPVLGAQTVPGEATRTFRKLSGRTSYNRLIGKTFVLRLSASGQASADRLPASEQIAFGGDEFGRGYEAALISGDVGAAVSTELAWRPAKLPKFFSGSELYVFSDGGTAHYRARNGFAGADTDFASLGGGARMRIAARSIVQLEATRALKDVAYFENNQKWHLLVTMRSAF